MRSIGIFLWFCFAFVAAAQLPENSGLRPIPSDPSIARPALSPEARGDIFMARKMYREAADVYRQPPENPILANKIGIAFHQMTALSDAKRQYERAVRLKPDYSEAINNLGTIYYAQKNYRKAITHYKRALKVNPNSASIYSNLGTAFFARKKYDEAFDAYQKALSIDPEVFEHRSTQGVLLQERNVTERAKFHYYLAKTYAKSGNAERALDYMRKSIEEGFKERNKFLEEPEFASLQSNPDFQMLLKLESRVL
ncbi:MAG: tetratricopeptide repeat protein [Acidobacteria bacterium]|jgi:tetratricopeptide (TPR) repeat protein|nr:tetratricopeptide repeat protein [Acidobacteriota bacterium]